jgi:hypothetical protein
MEYPRAAKKNMDFKILTLKEQRVMNRVAKVVMDHMELPIKQMRINMVTG